jgi:hypothetical protein
VKRGRIVNRLSDETSSLHERHVPQRIEARDFVIAGPLPFGRLNIVIEGHFQNSF